LASGATFFNTGHVQVNQQGVIFVLDPIERTVRRLTPLSIAPLEIVAGNNASGSFGAQIPVSVRVRDSGNTSVAGALVTFAVTAGDATLTSASVVSGADGVARATVRLGNRAGEVRLAAQTPGAAAVTITLRAEAPVASRITADAANAAFAIAGAEIDLRATVLGQGGVPAPGAATEWRVVSGDLQLVSSSSVAAAAGLTTAKLRAGATPGPAVVQVGSPGLATPLAISLMVVAPAPAIEEGSVVGAGGSNPPLALASPLGVMSLRGVRLLPFSASAAAVTESDLVEGRYPTLFRGICVDFGGQRAPIVSVGESAVAFQVPLVPVETAEAPVAVIRDCGTPHELRSAPVRVAVAEQAPELLTVEGAALAFTESGEPINAASPAGAGSVVELRAVGLGATEAATQPGEIPTANTPVRRPIRLRWRGELLPEESVLSVQALAGQLGRYAIRFRLPEAVEAGSAEIAIASGADWGTISPSVVLPLK
jgi:uncharacterized protein (TIGR03437 family)